MQQLVQTGTGRVLVVGHRGASALAPENTWPALKKGFESGADLLELDVQLTRDGQAVIIHDFTLQPKHGDPRWICDMSWDELSDLDVGSWFSDEFAGERMPCLADVLDWARERVALWVDLKHGLPGSAGGRLEMVALDLIEEASMTDRVVISSWDQVALGRIGARRPEIPLVVNIPQRLADPVGFCRSAGAQWAVLFWPQVDRQAVAQLQAAGLIVTLTNLFTGDYAEVTRLGVDVVSSSDPGVVREALAKGEHE